MKPERAAILSAVLSVGVVETAHAAPKGVRVTRTGAEAAQQIRVGDVVWIPPGKKHWHGAGPKGPMAHIAIVENTKGGSPDWMEKVSDEQYVTNDEQARRALSAAHREMIRTMLEARTDELGALLDAGYSLTHMTGYEQPRKEWLAAIDSGRMRYHSAKETSIDIELQGDRAQLVGRSVVDATIYGGRGTWNLQLTTDYVRRNDRWIAMKTVATTY